MPSRFPLKTKAEPISVELRLKLQNRNWFGYSSRVVRNLSCLAASRSKQKLNRYRLNFA
jgi:hypothetical protein